MKIGKALEKMPPKKSKKGLGVESGEDKRQSRWLTLAALALGGFTFLTLILRIPFVLITRVPLSMIDMINSLVGMILAGLVLWFNRKGIRRLAAWLLVLGMLVYVFEMAYLEGNPPFYPVAALGFLVIIVLAMALLNTAEAWAVFGVVCAAYIALNALWFRGYLPPPIQRVPESAAWFSVLVWISTAAITMSVLGSAFAGLERWAKTLERRVIERTLALEEANEELRVLSRIKDEFVSKVSHELRSPIASLKLHLHILRSRPGKDDETVAALERETLRLGDVVEDLLYLSRLDQGRVRFIFNSSDINSLVADYVSDRSPLATNRGLTLTLRRLPDLPSVWADERQLGRVVNVLLTNALNYTPEGGRVELSTEVCQFDGKEWAGFKVSDTGPGISLEEQAQLFERFHRGKAAQESGVAGTGLGLAIAQEIIDQHQGRIEMESEGKPGKGAIFSVWLPALPREG